MALTLDAGQITRATARRPVVCMMHEDKVDDEMQLLSFYSYDEAEAWLQRHLDDVKRYRQEAVAQT